MTITYPVDTENTRWAVLKLSTGEIVGRNKKWPVADGSEIQGADPDYVYLLQVKATPPDYDSRLYYLQTEETVDADANTLTTSHTAIKRTIEDQKIAAENVEAEQAYRQIDLAKEVLQTRFALTSIIKYAIDGETLPAKVGSLLDTYAAKGVKLYKNRDRLEAILADIDNGLEPDLDAGWETID